MKLRNRSKIKIHSFNNAWIVFGLMYKQDMIFLRWPDALKYASGLVREVDNG